MDATLPPVEVTGARSAPQAVVWVDAQSRERPLAELLAGLPGLHAADRGNGAQDLQLSSRGFGARTGFGIRGLRLVVDGIPASSPDGSGSLNAVSLASLERVEWLRGPFSALYGANSGGVLLLHTAPARGDEPLQLRTATAAFGERQLQLQGGTRVAGQPARWLLEHEQREGWRPHQAQQRQLAELRVDAGAWRWQLQALSQPADDPQGISRAQWDSGLLTAPQPLAFNTRKTLQQQQLGLRWRDGGTQLAAWAGRRAVWQWQSIPVAVQAPASHPGGVIRLRREYAGLDAQQQGQWAGWRWTAGLAAEGQWDARQGFENFIGSQLGLTGALRRDERNRALGLDAYAQAQQGPWRLGLRGSRLRLASRDAFLANGDDSGSRLLNTWSPVLGWQHTLTNGWTAFASAGAAQETPTLNELAYRADGSGGFNTQLQPQRSRQLEAGLRRAGLELTLFTAQSRDEIVVAASRGGRASFTNAGRSRRHGLEFSAEQALAPGWQLDAQLTLLRARLSGGATDNPLPGAPARQASLQLRWQPAEAWQLGLRASARSRLPADTLGNAAPGHGLLNLQAQHRGRNALGPWQLTVTLDNLADRRHAASVIVGEANGRFLEPGAPRRWGLSWQQSLGS